VALLSARSSSAIRPVVVSLISVALTTAALWAADAGAASDHLIIGYLFPVTLIAMYYGSMFGLFAALIGGGAAVYFLLQPQYSFQVSDPRHVAEVGFFLVLALIGSKVTAMLTRR
jgi:two-component system sensor histidine kinase KdpD